MSSLGKTLTVPAETVMAHIGNYRKLALDEGLDAIVVSIWSPTTPNATIGIMLLNDVPLLKESLQKLVDEKLIAVFMDLYPSLAFSCIEEQAAFSIIMRDAPKT